ncbi:Uncharacterised protein [Clostridioides difficile]|nr:Uncharacterised protein [Clostridioides difficile]
MAVSINGLDDVDPRRVRSRNRLLDATAVLLRSGGVEAVTVEAVTSVPAAGDSRAAAVGRPDPCGSAVVSVIRPDGHGVRGERRQDNGVYRHGEPWRPHPDGACTLRRACPGTSWHHRRCRFRPRPGGGIADVCCRTCQDVKPGTGSRSF